MRIVLLGQVHADVVAHPAALLDARLDPLALDRRDAEDDAPVVEEDAVADADVAGEALVLDGDDALVAERVALDERDLAPVGQRRSVAGNVPVRIFGPQRSCSAATAFCFVARRLPQPLEARAVLLVRAVREVEPRDVHPRVDERREALERVARGAERADELGAAR